MTVLKRKIGILIKLCRKKTQLSEEIEEPAEGKDEKKKSKDEMKKPEKDEKQKEKEKKGILIL